MSRRRALSSVFGILWTPIKLLPGLFGWYDPSDNNYVTLSGALITQLKDKSGNGNTLFSQGSGATSTTINGRRAVALDASNNGVFGINTASVLSTNNLAVAMVMASTVTSNGYGRFLSIGNNNEYGNDYNIKGYLDVSNGSDNKTLLAETNGNYAGGGALASTPQIIDAVYSSANTIATSINGSPAASTGINYSFYVYSKFIYLFGAQNGYSQPSGIGGEAIIGTVAWPADTLARIQGYLAWRWGTQALLPSAHRYKRGPPYAELPAGYAQTASGLLVPANDNHRLLVPGFRLAA